MLSSTFTREMRRQTQAQGEIGPRQEGPSRDGEARPGHCGAARHRQVCSVPVEQEGRGGAQTEAGPGGTFWADLAVRDYTGGLSFKISGAVQDHAISIVHGQQGTPNTCMPREGVSAPAQRASPQHAAGGRTCSTPLQCSRHAAVSMAGIYSTRYLVHMNQVWRLVLQHPLGQLAQQLVPCCRTVAWGRQLQRRPQRPPPSRCPSQMLGWCSWSWAKTASWPSRLSPTGPARCAASLWSTPGPCRGSGYPCLDCPTHVI